MLACVFVYVYNFIPKEFWPFSEQKNDSSLQVEVIKNQDLSIHFLELGNKYTGDCTLIKTGDTEVLIDAGSKVDSILTIKNYLDQYVTDNKIEFVIVTHAHEDHYAGFATPEDTKSLFDWFNIETVIQFAKVTTSTQGNDIYTKYLRELSELQDRCQTKVFTALDCIDETHGAQTKYKLNDGIVLEILDQKYYREDTNDENNNSVCCQIVQNEKNYYLFTGDLEKSGEESLVKCNTLHEVVLYKAGHHGSKTSSNNALLEVIKPKIVCVCCCAGSTQYRANPENRFPAQDFINRIAQYTEKVYVTTLFTFEWKRSIEMIEYAKTLVPINKIVVGGIASTLMPDEYEKATGIRPVTGLLNEPGKLGYPGDDTIDSITPDYTILDDIASYYHYPYENAYFMYSTRG